MIRRQEVRRRDTRRRVRTLTALAVTLLAMVGCSSAPGDTLVDVDGAAADEPELRAELLEMKEADQAELTGEPVREDPRVAHTVRLTAIIEEYGWPTRTLVGNDGASAAWLIAQHADHSVAFQERALDLMRVTAAEGEADPTEVAYLEDRVALSKGQPQTYGTQLWCTNGEISPAVPIIDEDQVDERRAEVGLQPLADYIAEYIDFTDCR